MAILEPRSTLEMWEEALELLTEREFQVQVRLNHWNDADGEYLECTECKASVDIPKYDPLLEKPVHKEHCRMARALRELEAFVQIEQKLEREKEGSSPQ